MPQEPTLANALAGYGHDYVDPRLGMDSADSGTQNVLSLMSARKAAKDRAPYEALSRLLATAMTPFASMPQNALGANAVGPINRAALRRLTQEDAAQPPRLDTPHAALAKGEQPQFGRNVFDFPGWDVNVGMPSGDAVRALGLAKGDMSVARNLLDSNPKARNVLNYWGENPNFGPRKFADPPQSRAYWDALDSFTKMELPAKKQGQ